MVIYMCHIHLKIHLDKKRPILLKFRQKKIHSYIIMSLDNKQTKFIERLEFVFDFPSGTYGGFSWPDNYKSLKQKLVTNGAISVDFTDTSQLTEIRNFLSQFIQNIGYVLDDDSEDFEYIDDAERALVYANKLIKLNSNRVIGGKRTKKVRKTKKSKKTKRVHRR